MRILGIDYGDTRTGLAISDPEEKMAFTIGTVVAKDIDTAARLTAEKAETYPVEKIVLGLPKNMDGSEGFRAEKTRKFAAALQCRFPSVPIEFSDERLTTVAASYYLNETNTRGKKRKQNIDTLSAQIILQNYLDQAKNKAQRDR